MIPLGFSYSFIVRTCVLCSLLFSSVFSSFSSFFFLIVHNSSSINFLLYMHKFGVNIYVLYFIFANLVHIFKTCLKQHNICHKLNIGVCTCSYVYTSCSYKPVRSLASNRANSSPPTSSSLYLPIALASWTANMCLHIK